MLEIGPGSGRNLKLLRSFMDVAAVEDQLRSLAFNDERFAAVLSTHALLHGTPKDIQSLLAEIRRVCKPGALLFATFGSQKDDRFGEGTRLTANCFAPIEGDEAGIPHSFFTVGTLRELLREFTIERLDEVGVDEIAGSWAHRQKPLRGAVHWFAVLKKP